MESLLRSRVLPTFGGVEVARITPQLVRQWVTAMSAEGLSASRIRQARWLLRASLEQAVADGIIGRNPTSHVKVPTAVPREHRYLTAAQVEQLTDAAEERQHSAGLLISFLAFSGVRWGEAVALRRSDVDLLRRRVVIARSTTEVSGRLVTGTPKTHRSRTLVLPRLLTDPLAAHLGHVDPHGLVFTTSSGSALRNSNFRRSVWRPSLASAGINPELRVHDLRHTAASLMISAGASIKAVQLALGHASAKVTLDTYAGLFTDDLEALADRLDDRFGDPGAPRTRPEPSGDVVELTARNPMS